MSKSYKENIKQHKQSNPKMTIRSQRESEEAERELHKYIGVSFLTTNYEDDNEDFQ